MVKEAFTLGGDIPLLQGRLGVVLQPALIMLYLCILIPEVKGLFAGISLNGLAIEIDEKGNAAFYGNNTGAKTLFSNSTENNSASVTKLKSELKGMYQ